MTTTTEARPRPKRPRYAQVRLVSDRPPRDGHGLRCLDCGTLLKPRDVAKHDALHDMLALARSEPR